MLNLLLEVSKPMTGSGANNRDVKKINRIRTIRSIFSCDRISQPELAAKVNNSWPTVLQNVKELMAMGLVQEVGSFESTGGRKARAFAPVRNARLAVGLEITQNHVGAVLVDLSGNLLHYERKKRLYERSDTYAEMLAGIVQGLIEKEGCPVEKILGVGISLPGILDKEGQTLVYSHALGLRNVPTEEFSRYIPFSCRFINDANAAGLAEVRDLESPRSLVYLSLSNSVGGAILTGGALYGGDHLRAGEFGHNTLVPDGRPCYCGKKGCLDAYCSAKVLSQLTDGNLALFFDGLRSGNAALQTAWNEYLSYLAANGSATQRELADYFLVDPAAVSRALDAFEQGGFLITEPASDRRTKKIRLTQRGVVLASAWDVCCDEIDEAMLKGFSAEERKSFATLLMRVRENLENYARGEA